MAHPHVEWSQFQRIGFRVFAILLEAVYDDLRPQQELLNGRARIRLRRRLANAETFRPLPHLRESAFGHARVFQDQAERWLAAQAWPSIDSWELRFRFSFLHR